VDLNPLASGPAEPGTDSETPPLPGPIGKYRIVRLLGKGGMGAVYQAFDPHLEREVALKVMLPQIADDPEQKQRFEREARAVARMMHPNVVTVFDLGYHTDGSPYIVMELMKGRDLLGVLRDGPLLGLERKIAVTLQVLEGLGHAHNVGIVHRDIKPANVFITEDGTAKIMDFGVARFAAGSATSSGVLLGTANYMSPEQVTGGPLDGRSDLFSVGCMLCEMLTGHRPFEAESVVATLYKIAQQEPSLPMPDGPEYAGLRPILVRALARGVSERYPTAADFAEDLRAFLARSPAGATAAAPSGAGAPEPRAGDPTHTLRLKAAAAEAAGSRSSAPAPADPTPLFRLLREIYVGGKSGHLHLAHGHERRSLRLLRGRIVNGSSDVEGEHLGDVLVRYGLLTHADLERAVAVVLRDRKRLGDVLGEMGLLDRPRLEDAVGLHVREILFAVLERPGGSFAFEEQAESLMECDLASRLSTGEVILEATRRVQDPTLIRRALGDTGRMLVLSSDPLLRTQKITLTPTDGFILSRIDGTLSAREVISLIPLPAEDVERSLFGLLCTGMVDRLADKPVPRRPPREAGHAAAVRSRPEPTPPAPASGPAPPPGPVTPPPAVAPPPSAAPSGNTTTAEGRRIRTPVEVRQLIVEAYEGLAAKTHFEVLGIPRGASEADVRQAYAGLARVLHPDACRGPEFADVQEKRDAVFIRLGQAFETLRDAGSRAEYERRLDLWKPRPTRPTPAPSSAAPSSPSATAPPSGPVAPGGPAAGPATPVSTPPPDASAPDTVMDRAQAVASIQAAEKLLKEEKYWDAIQKLEPAIPKVDGALRIRAKIALARAYVKNPMWRRRAEETLQSVIRENPKQVEAYLLLAGIYRDANLPARAKAMYRKVLDLDPQNAEAFEALGPPLEAEGGGSSEGTIRRLFSRR
jgi:curved DNA-binding protein CbpA